MAVSIYADPINVPELWDSLVTADLLWGPPRRWVVIEGASRPYKIDQKDPAGAEGATTTYRGLKPSEFTIKLMMAPTFQSSAEDFAFLAQFLSLFQIDANKKAPEAINILHPALAANDIFNVLPKSVGHITYSQGGVYTVSIEVVEYKPAKKANVTTTPKSSASAEKTPTVKTISEEDLAAQLSRAVPSLL